MNNPIDKPLPSSEESERVILGAVLLDNSVIAQAVEQLTPNDFYSPLNRRVFAAMISLFDQSKQIDPILIGEELKKEGSLESIGGISTITNLTFGLPHFSNVEGYIKVVKDKATLRNLIRTCNAVTGDALAEEEEAGIILDRAEHAIYQLYDRGQASTASRMEHEVAETMIAAKQRSETGDIVIGIPTGFRSLDMRLQGYRKSQYVVIAARPSIGKTAIGVRQLYNISTITNEPVLLFSCEMAKSEISERVVAAEGNIDSYMLRAGRLSDAEWDEATRIQAKLTETSGFFINDTPRITLRGIRTEVRRVNSKLRPQKKKLGIIMVDHVGLMGNDVDKRGRSREGEVSDISKGLKQLAREEDCTVIALSQLNRGSEIRSDHRPMKSDLRESGSLEQDADVVLLLFREDEYQSDPSLHTNVAEVIIAKNRNGPTGVVKMSFIRKYAKFTDLSEEVREDFPLDNEGVLL